MESPLPGSPTLRASQGSRESKATEGLDRGDGESKSGTGPKPKNRFQFPPLVPTPTDPDKAQTQGLWLSCNSLGGAAGLEEQVGSTGGLVRFAGEWQGAALLQGGTAGRELGNLGLCLAEEKPPEQTEGGTQDTERGDPDKEGRE